MQQADWSERTSRTTRYQHHQPRPEPQEAPHPNHYQGHRKAFHHAHTTLGATGHLLHMGMVAAPLVIGEMIHDPDKKWRAMRLVPVIGALASEALWTMKIAHDRNREKEDHAALDACREEHCR